MNWLDKITESIQVMFDKFLQQLTKNYQGRIEIEYDSFYEKSDKKPTEAKSLLDEEIEHDYDLIAVSHELIRLIEHNELSIYNEIQWELNTNSGFIGYALNSENQSNFILYFNANNMKERLNLPVLNKEIITAIYAYLQKSLDSFYASYRTIHRNFPLRISFLPPVLTHNNIITISGEIGIPEDLQIIGRNITNRQEFLERFILNLKSITPPTLQEAPVNLQGLSKDKNSIELQKELVRLVKRIINVSYVLKDEFPYFYERYSITYYDTLNNLLYILKEEQEETQEHIFEVELLETSVAIVEKIINTLSTRLKGLQEKRDEIQKDLRNSAVESRNRILQMELEVLEAQEKSTQIVNSEMISVISKELVKKEGE